MSYSKTLQDTFSKNIFRDEKEEKEYFTKIVVDNSLILHLRINTLNK